MVIDPAAWSRADHAPLIAQIKSQPIVPIPIVPTVTSPDPWLTEAVATRDLERCTANMAVVAGAS